jgi:hypothetical protein
MIIQNVNSNMTPLSRLWSPESKIGEFVRELGVQRFRITRQAIISSRIPGLMEKWKSMTFIIEIDHTQIDT